MKKLSTTSAEACWSTAILLLAVMMSLGFAVMSVGGHSDTPVAHRARARVDLQPRRGLAVGADLHPGTPRHGPPDAARTRSTAARPSSAEDAYFCPLSAQIAKSYNGSGQVDFNFSSTTDGWRTYVRDDRDPVTGQPVRFWDDEIINPANTKFASWARYDADNNRHVWVRSEAIVRGRKRAIVAWVRIEDSVINFPQYAVLAGKVGGKNSGGHGGRPLVNSTGSSLGIAVRCSTPPQSASCIDLNPTKGPQLQPPANFQLNYPRQSALENPDALQALEDVAKANGTYYAGCPANPNGKIVVIENAGDCGYTNSAPAAPGASQVLQQPWRTPAS